MLALVAGASFDLDTGQFITYLWFLNLPNLFLLLSPWLNAAAKDLLQLCCLWHHFRLRVHRYPIKHRKKKSIVKPPPLHQNSVQGTFLWDLPTLACRHHCLPSWLSRRAHDQPLVQLTPTSSWCTAKGPPCLSIDITYLRRQQHPI